MTRLEEIDDLNSFELLELIERIRNAVWMFEEDEAIDEIKQIVGRPEGLDDEHE